ncbi:COP9 signalosome complex subunit 1 [Capsicum chinense]|nr:COP9 signalosome complex subunit 1 [Capsicum chinense]
MSDNHKLMRSRIVGTNLIKKSIRMGYNDFGDFYYAHGQLEEASKNYDCTRNYCTTTKHIIHMCLNAILVNIEMGQFTHVTSYVSKAGQSQDALDVVTVAKLCCAVGLANLEAKKHKLAARKLHNNNKKSKRYVIFQLANFEKSKECRLAMELGYGLD